MADPERVSVLEDPDLVGQVADALRPITDAMAKATMRVTLEELVVARADKLFKGVRKPKLEERVIDLVAGSVGKSRWDVFVDLDTCFEAIAADGADRLERSKL
jgi:hypothetical protein